MNSCMGGSGQPTSIGANQSQASLGKGMQEIGQLAPPLIRVGWGQLRAGSASGRGCGQLASRPRPPG